MKTQKEAAMDSMVAWLSDENELGRSPFTIECAGEFDLHEMHYYIFKYRADESGEWLTGVCGGYDEGALEHCGHVFSNMEKYSSDTAYDDAVEMVEMIRRYCMDRAEEELKQGKCLQSQDDGGDAANAGNEGSGSFVGFVLLSSASCDMEKFKFDLMEDWAISCSEEDDPLESEGSLIFNVDGAMVALSLMASPVPNQEAEHNAANNYMWPDAVKVTKTHVAHLMVAVLGHGLPVIEVGKLFVKICSACLKQENAIGIYTSGTVFEPEFYIKASTMMCEGDLPLFNWLYFGLYQTENGLNGYTYGMTAFGKEEIEVLESRLSPQDLRNFIFDIAYYVLDGDVTLNDGDTIGFSEEQKLKITRSEGVAVDKDSLKIELE